MLELKDFQEQLEELYGAYPTFKLTPKQEDVWFHRLKDMPLPLLELGISQMINTKPAFPSIADIRSVISDVLSDDVDDAFNELMEKSHALANPRKDFEGNSFPPSLSPALKQALKRMGGAQAFLSLSANQKEVNFFKYRFAQIWESIINQKNLEIEASKISSQNKTKELESGMGVSDFLFSSNENKTLPSGVRQVSLISNSIEKLSNKKDLQGES